MLASILLQIRSLEGYQWYLYNAQIDHLCSFIFYVAVLLLVIPTVLNLSTTEDRIITEQNSYRGFLPTLIVFIAIILFWGFRTKFGWYPGDTIPYLWGWDLSANDASYAQVKAQGDEWIWVAIQRFVRSLGGDFAAFCTFTVILYVGIMTWAAHRFINSHLWLVFLFLISSFSFSQYGVNGVRNGIATSLVMLGISFLAEKNLRGYAVALFTFVAGYYIHHSIYLSAICALLAAFLIKKPKTAIIIWSLAIPVSLVVGNAAGNFFSALGFDDRMEKYFVAFQQQDMSGFAFTGFRWDFLLYSAMPVLMIWYTTVKRNFEDRTYNIIAVTYLLANAFWILVIRAAFSNRFAYLSWFLYPIVIAYPLLRFHLWDDQDRKTALILLAYEAFTFFMFLIGKL